MKTREPDDKQLCNVVHIYIICVMPKPLDINKQNKFIETTALHNNIHSTQDFMEKVSKVTLQPGEYLSSYDVTALFTSVPLDPALKIMQGLLEPDTLLHNRTVLSVQNIIQLLGFCLHNT